MISLGLYILCILVLKRMLIKLPKVKQTKNNGITPRYKQTHLNHTQFFVTNDIVWALDKLSPSVVASNTINSFKNKFDHHPLQQGLQ